MDVLGFLAGKASTIVQNPAIDYKKFALGASWAIFGLESYILSVSSTSLHRQRSGYTDQNVPRSFSTRQLPCYSIPAPPAALAEHIPEDTYKKSQAYGRDKTRWALFKQAYHQTLNALYIGGGAYKWAWTLTGGWMTKMGLGGDRVVSLPPFYDVLYRSSTGLDPHAD